jgi:hypothetical protein
MKKLVKAATVRINFPVSKSIHLRYSVRAMQSGVAMRALMCAALAMVASSAKLLSDAVKLTTKGVKK